MLLRQVFFLHLSMTSSHLFAKYYWNLLMTSSCPFASETSLFLTFDHDRSLSHI